MLVVIHPNAGIARLPQTSPHRRPTPQMRPLRRIETSTVPAAGNLAEADAIQQPLIGITDGLSLGLPGLHTITCVAKRPGTGNSPTLLCRLPMCPLLPI